MDTKDPAFADPRPKTRAEQARDRLLDAILPHVVFDGWNASTLAAAANDIGMSEGEVQLYCPSGVLDLIETWSINADNDAKAIIFQSPEGRIRDRITQAVLTRLDQYAGLEEAAERARARLLLPDGVDRGARMVWATSDMIWRAIGDQSTDGNFYSKRAILSGVYGSTLAIWMSDSDADKARTRDFLDNRIDNVMQIEKAKARWRDMTKDLPDLTGLASKLRYGASRRNGF